jgi:hypothetical protein
MNEPSEIERAAPLKRNSEGKLVRISTLTTYDPLTRVVRIHLPISDSCHEIGIAHFGELKKGK